jgi:hypothetical protein
MAMAFEHVLPRANPTIEMHFDLIANRVENGGQRAD